MVVRFTCYPVRSPVTTHTELFFIFASMYTEKQNQVTKLPHNIHGSNICQKRRNSARNLKVLNYEDTFTYMSSCLRNLFGIEWSIQDILFGASDPTN